MCKSQNNEDKGYFEPMGDIKRKPLKKGYTQKL